jgi:adenine-specific DNA-methyltransferase
MAMQLQKLELTWIGKEDNPKLEPRILIEDTDKSFGDFKSNNMLVHGDNLLSLKALEQAFAGKIKCIYIDPPYNTGNAFEHYDDGIEHSLWLSLMRPRLEILWRLLHRTDGSIWISIDDDEMPYLRIVLDELFGRANFIACNVWQKRYSRENREAIGDVHEYILVYAKNPEKFKKNRNKLPLTNSQKNIYKNQTNDPRGPWRTIPMTAQGYRPNQMYKIKAPGGKVHVPPEGRCWSMIEEKFREFEKKGLVYYGKDNNSQPNIIRFLSEVEGVIPWTWWTSDEVGHTDEAKKEIHNLFGKESAFATPKPERLIQRILQIASNEGDIILDSFLGSGTTAAVAHKMNRKWIGVELGDQAVTLCIPRLKKVIRGEDKGGITETVNWDRGGGFKFYTLAPSLLKQDHFENWIIDTRYNPEMLAAAMAKHEGFHYSPDETNYWKQGFSSEKDFIFTTTQFVTVQMLDRLADELKPDESILACCKSFSKACINRHKNITIKKIPQMLLGRCEFGKDDYSLNIINLPHDNEALKEENLEDAQIATEIKTSKSKKKRTDENQPSLF